MIATLGYTLAPMRLIRKLFLLVALLLLGWGGFYYYNQITDGFSLHQISSSLPPYPQFEVPLEEDQKREMQNFLSQPFRYLGKGAQFYAFESADGKYVLKFLKHKHLRPFTRLNSVPLPRKLREICDAKIERRKKRVENLFASCKLAYEEICEETGLLYIHLNRTPSLESKVVLIDKIGRKHRIDLDQHEFMVQMRAISVKEAFAAVTSNEQVHELIEQLIDVVSKRCEKGIADRDRAFVQNVAFCISEPRALFIDTGQFYKETEMCTEGELKKRLGGLRHWTECNFPEFVPVVENYLD